MIIDKSDGLDSTNRFRYRCDRCDREFDRLLKMDIKICDKDYLHISYVIDDYEYIEDADLCERCRGEILIKLRAWINRQIRVGSKNKKDNVKISESE